MAKLNPDLQQRFMYLFERVGEPLYFGPRGESNVFYNVPTDKLDGKMQDAVTQYRAGMRPSTGMSVQVKPPARMPDLESFSNVCPRSTLFSHFIPSHRKAAWALRQILLAQQSTDDFLAMACACRDSDAINPRLWIYACASACIQRADLKGFRIPAIWEVMPDQFVGPSVIRQAQRQAVLPLTDRAQIVIPRNVTGNDSNPENKLAYFREDLGISSHHWHWHLVYPQEVDLNSKRIDRKGELFYWMHHDMLARYDAERLANGLHRVQSHSLTEVIPEGYFPKLYNTNSGILWGTRQEGSRAGPVDRPLGAGLPGDIKLDWEDMMTWRTRIFEAIDTGVVVNKEGKTERLSVERGIDILGDLIEASNYSINKQFYGDFHNMGHVSLAYCHDPFNRHKEEMSVMGDVATTMRDPIFYRWHKYIDEMFGKYKQTLPPYTTNELVWSGIRVTDISVQIEGRNREKNILATNWMQSDVDLSRGLDFGRTNERTLGAIWATITHLDYEKFAYTINVQNSGKSELSGTVRIFLAPRLSETRSRFDFEKQRIQFFTLDKFTTVLRPGDNTILRHSTDSTVTIPWEQTFRDLERDMLTPSPQSSICGCGWPQHMLLPRGTTDGMLFDLYVIVTDGAKDHVPRANPSSTEAGRRGCRDAVSYCGILDEKYPDARPMGFPFDRIRLGKDNRPLTNLDAFVAEAPNSKYTQIRIVHQDKTIIRTGGAPAGMPKIMMGTPPGTPPPSRSPSPTQQKPKPIELDRGRGYNDDRNQGRGHGGRWHRPYQGYDRHRDHSPSGWPRGYGDE